MTTPAENVEKTEKAEATCNCGSGCKCGCQDGQPCQCGTTKSE